MTDQHAKVVRHTKQAPPPSGQARDVRFPPIVRTTLANGLEIDTVEQHDLPLVAVRLVVKSGDSADPANMPGMASLVAQMLKEGTRTRTSAVIADDVEFLGADLDVGSDTETTALVMRALSEHLERALGIMADVAMNPSFSEVELRKLKRRELDRLALQQQDPGFLGTREFYRVVYGPHPYAHIDTTVDVVNRVRRQDLAAWHRAHFLPNNAILVVVGDVTAAAVQQAAERMLGGWRRGTVREPQYATPPERTAREVIVVDRPDSVQSMISIGTLAIARSSPDYVPLMVANQVLGGSAASRLFMDLRERRSLTYGAYSGVGEFVQVAPFRARASVRNEVTAAAMDAFMEHLQRIVTEAVPAPELADAERYLSDSFPLRIDTAGKIAGLISDLRVFGLPDDYWETFRTQIRATTSEQALATARRHIIPERALIVVVGKAADVVEPLRRWGPVTVLDTDGRLLRHVDAATGPAATPAPAAR